MKDYQLAVAATAAATAAIAARTPLRATAAAFAGAALGLFAAVIVRRLRRPPVGVVVKLGGSCATHKSEFEIANFTVITETAAQLARRPSTAGDAVLLHGAGSFGHFQAHKHGTSKGLAGGGWLGFCDTRGSVTLLNNHVVRALVAAGVPAVGGPPCPATRLRRRKLQDFPPLLTPVADALNRGLVPVLHGDAVYDDDQGCAIVSGDALMVRLCDALQPELCVFLTDVAGVYDRPPSEPGAVLLEELLHVAVPEAPLLRELVQDRDVAAHDAPRRRLLRAVDPRLGVHRVADLLVPRVHLALGPAGAEAGREREEEEGRSAHAEELHLSAAAVRKNSLAIVAEEEARGDAARSS